MAVDITNTYDIKYNPSFQVNNAHSTSNLSFRPHALNLKIKIYVYPPWGEVAKS
jgi:hypothetical protein